MHRLKSILFFLTLSLLFSCSKTPKEKQLTMLDVFPNNIDKTFVISFDTINDFNETIKNNKRFYSINSSKPFFIRNDKIEIPVNFSKIFSTCPPTFCYKQKNSIEVLNLGKGLLVKKDTIDFTIKNSKKLFKRNFLNRGENPELADNPKKLLVIVGCSWYKNKSFPKKEFLQQLDTISKAYFEFLKDFNLYNKIDSLKREYPLNLIVTDIIRIPPAPEKPPKPAPIEIIE